MRPVIRYQSQLLYRKSYKPSRVIRIRPAKLYNAHSAFCVPNSAFEGHPDYFGWLAEQ